MPVRRECVGVVTSIASPSRATRQLAASWLTIPSAMRFPSVLLALCLSAACLTAQQPGSTQPQVAPSTEAQPSPPASGKEKPAGTVILNPESAHELAAAKHAFEAGVKLKKSGNLE